MKRPDQRKAPCAHLFSRFRRWPTRHRYRCTHCGFVTRLYDSLDRRMDRPVHPHMAVAVKGFNVTR